MGLDKNDTSQIRPYGNCVDLTGDSFKAVEINLDVLLDAYKGIVDLEVNYSTYKYDVIGL